LRKRAAWAEGRLDNPVGEWDDETGAIRKPMIRSKLKRLFKIILLPVYRPFRARLYRLLAQFQQRLDALYWRVDSRVWKSETVMQEWLNQRIQSSESHMLEATKREMNAILAEKLREMDARIAAAESAAARRVGETAQSLARHVDGAAQSLAGRIEKAAQTLAQHTDGVAQAMDGRIWKAEENIVQTMDGRIWKTEQSLTQRVDEAAQNLDGRIWKAEQTLAQSMDGRIWKAEENILQTVDGRIWEAELQISQQQSAPLYHALELRRTEYAIKKKILLLGTPGHNNIGDASIAAGEYEFIKRYFPDYALVEVSADQMDAQYAFIQSITGAEDLIFLHGGGNLGDLYLAEEILRRQVVNDFPDNPIIIFPQTIYFGATEKSGHERAVSSEIYNRHKNLILFTRGASSLAFAQEYFHNVKSFDSLDMALLLHREYRFAREGILACIRDANDESGIDDGMRENIYAITRRFDTSFEKTNNLYTQTISSQMRNMVINEELKKIARHKIVITDRLHGMLFAVITKTPCVVISAKTQKIREFYAYFMDSNAVFFIDKDISALGSAIEEASAVQTPEYPVLGRCLFDEMYKIICSKAMEI
jgi:pyruvyl transferase EpsI